MEAGVLRVGPRRGFRVSQRPSFARVCLTSQTVASRGARVWMICCYWERSARVPRSSPPHSRSRFEPRTEAS